MVLAFPTRSTAPPALETVSLISGVLATSPLVLQTHPASKALKWIGGKASLILPAQNIPANVSPEVGSATFYSDRRRKSLMRRPCSTSRTTNK